MKATIKLEVFGDNVRQQLELYTKIIDGAVPGLGRAFMGRPPKPSCWVAEILGTHPKYRYERRFLRGKKDYSRANSVGSRGIFLWYTLESGRVYQVQEQTSWRRTRRYFIRVTDEGEIEEIKGDEVKTWLAEKNLSE